MKSPHYFEFLSLIEWISENITGSQLQDVATSENGVVLSLYRYDKQPQVQWLVFDLDTQFPFFGLYDHNPWSGLKSAKPMGLFLKSNFHHDVVSRVEPLNEFGRVVQIHFNSGSMIEFRLIPKGPNLLASVGRKKLAWSKPKDLVRQDLSSLSADLESRSVPFMLNQWFERRQVVRKKQTQVQSLDAFQLWVAQRQRDIQKKRKALVLLREQIDNPKIRAYQVLGEHLKVMGFREIPEDLIILANFGQSASWNIQNCFDKSKQATQKIAGALKRAEFIEEELAHLQDLSIEKFQTFNKKQAQIREFNSARQKPVAEYRKLVLSEEAGLFCLMGKSAADNLKLLRQAKSWDLWLHLKDYPSAHAIIHKNKAQKISDEDLRKSAIWLARESSKKRDDLDGTKLSVVIVECRHVRPIKGDKIGRVSYNHPREMLITV